MHDAPSIYVTPLTTLGVVLMIFGSVLRLTCFSKLGKLFTFDLTILPSHTLITSGPYAYVRHPAYTGTLSMSLGLALINFTRGSWVTECGVVGHGMTGIGIRSMVACAWFGWWVAVGIKRCESEDAELRKMFGKEWDTYASTVRAWFVPGLI
ncbi:hypothetical protein PHLCEN_2v13697 [Hermanssonia centrifuga]|uniref:Protein-S-isoprenylcysteine O-methyltransferase n=1 Tax=Hermanssonia centrifuga TaxID=98765 RepID=A0A2R6NDQ5_9APHY|nr:hypothetical protein PHLCEN_2v13697 [Hermanssonia centrifuga]